MKEINKEDIRQEVFNLYDDYAHNRLDRRSFLDKLSAYAVGGLTLPALLSFIMPNYQDTLQTQPDDPRLTSEFITYVWFSRLALDLDTSAIFEGLTQIPSDVWAIIVVSSVIFIPLLCSLIIIGRLGTLINLQRATLEELRKKDV